MAQTVTLLGVSYSIPETTDANFDVQLTAYLKALASAFPQLNGGTQSLTAELDFGVSFGVKAAWFKSETANPASAGQVRLAKTDSIKIRNNANGADLALAIDTGDNLTFGGANVTGNPALDATTAAGQSIPNSTATIVVFGTVVRDSDSGYNSGTGRYTIPAGKGGDYVIASGITWNAAPGTSPNMSIYKNAVELRRAPSNANVPGGISGQSISATVTLIAGDIIDIRLQQASGGAVVLASVAAANYLTLKRIPT